jgi:thiamine-monophosphate kinase
MEIAREYNVELVGGDISRSPDKLVIDSIVSGEVARGKAILRSGAMIGDGIYVTGTVGGAAAGLRLLEKGVRYAEDLDENTRTPLLRQLKPQPKLSDAKAWISMDFVTSMIDVSDGLSSDLAHLCRASGVGAEIDPDLLPLDPALVAHFPSAECLSLGLNGGEDFELLFTARDGPASIADATRIGTITTESGVIGLRGDGRLRSKGFQHF